MNLHSSYDPEKEASRFVENLEVKTEPETIILCGAGNGYLQAALTTRFPAARILSLFFSPGLRVRENRPGDFAWHPGMGSNAGDFLRLHLGELDLKGLLVVEWPPSFRIFGASARAIREEVSQLIRERGGSLLTSCALGKLWLRNSFTNYICREKLYSLTPHRTTRPVLLAGSGPSLEHTVKVIKDCRKGIDLWALPSAVTLLLSRDIYPDMVVMTDPGYYSIYHLRELKGTGFPLLMPLSAATGSWRLGARVAYLGQSNFFEQLLLARLKLQQPVLPPGGTVAATALELAIGSTGGPVITTGLDFCYQDIKSHALPNPFIHFLQQDASRLSPLYSRACLRAWVGAPQREKKTGIRISRPLQTYAGWFNQLGDTIKRRAYMLESGISTRLNFPHLSPGNLKQLAEGTDSASCLRWAHLADYPSRTTRTAHVQQILREWQETLSEEKHANTPPDMNNAGPFHNRILNELGYFTVPEKLNRWQQLRRQPTGQEAKELHGDMLQTIREFLAELQTRYNI